MRAALILLNVTLALACAGAPGEPPCTAEALKQSAVQAGAVAASAQVTDFVCFRENAMGAFASGGDAAVGLFEWDGVAWRVEDLGSGIGCPWGEEVCRNLRVAPGAGSTRPAAVAPAPKASPTKAAASSGGATCYSFKNDGQELHYSFDATCNGYDCQAVSGSKCERVCASLYGDGPPAWAPRAEVDQNYGHRRLDPSECGGAPAAASRPATPSTGGAMSRPTSAPRPTTTRPTTTRPTTTRPTGGSTTGNSMTRPKR